MGIYIPNMEMPTQCGNCPMSTNARRCTILWREFGDPSERLEDCPLIPLPEGHGRLIDAEELRKAMYHEAFETDSHMQKWESGCWIRYRMFERNLETVPTIVPAE